MGIVYTNINVKLLEIELKDKDTTGLTAVQIWP